MRIVHFTLIAVLLSLSSWSYAEPDRLVIHEWGTFTSLQDEDGQAVGGINSDDEALPPFVHDLMLAALKPSPFTKGLPECFPSVTMRLETPVLYFHPAPGATLPPLDVSAEFHGGLLTQFYPNAVAPLPHVSNGRLETLTPETTGTLAWRGLVVGGDQIGPPTEAHVWTAPRGAAAASVRAPNGETEKYLFYRGVGHLNAPVRVVRHRDALEFQNQVEFPLKDRALLAITAAYFCQIQSDGRCAWRAVDLRQLESIRAEAIRTAATFAPDDFSTENLNSLRTAMHIALVNDGLFDDEATAMLNTWELSYFKSAGTRLFFLVPQEWTNHYLPLHISVDADIHRVMMGRIDLVTPEHRQAMRQLATMDLQKNQAEFNSTYQHLGRFRNALLLDEQHRRPSTPVAAVLAGQGLAIPGK